MRRRDVIWSLASATLLSVGWPPIGRAQQDTKIHRIGLLSSGRSVSDDPTFNMLESVLKGLRDLGYIEGRNIVVERRYADFSPSRLRELAADLAALKVDLIVAGATTAARAARDATSVIPIVAGGMADPVSDELVASLARPGGNVTGTTFLGPELVAKRLQMLRDVVPGLSRVAALWHPTAYSERTTAGLAKDTNDAAQTLGLQLQWVPAAGPEELDGAFAAIDGQRAQALIVLPSPMLYGQYQRIVGLTRNIRMPAIGAAREFADFGGLMSYGVNLSDLFRQTASHADKILKGAKPADLPVEQPTKFEFVINLKTAKELGLTISRELLLVADEVIE